MAGNVKVRINVQKLKKTLDNNLSQKKVREAAYNKAVELVDEIVKDTVDEFDAHPVTTELEQGHQHQIFRIRLARAIYFHLLVLMQLMIRLQD